MIKYLLFLLPIFAFSQVTLLVQTTDHGGIKDIRKGDLNYAIFSPPKAWGNKEGLPNYIQLRINGATEEDIRPYTEPWYDDLNVISTDGGDSLLIESQLLTSANWIRMTPARRSKIRTFLFEMGYEVGQIKDKLDTGIKVPTSGYSAAELLYKINDVFVDIYRHRRYNIKRARIDIWVAAGNDAVTINLNQFLNYINDKTETND